jgi:hypothetical protein
VQVFVLDKRLKRRITMGDEKTNVTMDANKFYSQASKDLKSMIGGAKVDTSIIYNDTKDSVTHYGLVTAGQDARWCAPPQAFATRLLYGLPIQEIRLAPKKSFECSRWQFSV